MTSPVTPPAAPVVPLYPPLGSATFNADAYAYGTAMPGVVDGINDLAGNAHTNALSSVESATAAASAAASAADVQAVVLGAANFKGLWSALTGPLLKPATVKDNGRFWLLLSDLPDVTAAVPGVSAAWAALDTGVSPTQYITSNATVVPGVRYIIGAAGITLDMSATTWLKGDYFGVREAIGSGTYTLNFGTTKDRTQTRGSVVITAGYRQLDRTYEDATRGLI